MAKQKYRRLFSFLLALLLLACPVLEANAAEIQPRMTLIYSGDCRSPISGGKVSANAWVQGIPGVTSCEVTLEIQEKGLIFWDTVWENSTTETGDYASLSGAVTATPGKSYRAKATFTVWSGTQSESKTLTTDWREA